MKVKITYEIKIEKEIEVTPEEYCAIRANHENYPNVFPEGSYNQHIASYKEMEAEAQEAMDTFWKKNR